MGTHAHRERVERLLRPLPALVPVHRVVAADDRRQLRRRQLREIGHGRGRRDVPSVGEGVDPRPLLELQSTRELEQGPEVVDVGVDAAVGDEPEQMDCAAARPRPLERADERFVLEERALADRLRSPAAGPGRGFGRSRSSGGRPRSFPSGPREAQPPRRRPQRRVRILPPEPVEDGRTGQLDGVARPRRRTAPPVEDDERYEVEAARQIAAKESGSSEAPPTRAPSIDGWASRSAAFSGLTEPP